MVYCTVLWRKLRRFVASPEYIRMGWKIPTLKNTLSYCKIEIIMVINELVVKENEESTSR
jgi:hypothetical protein